MYVTGVQLNNFRNYQFISWQPRPGGCIIAGANAAGKTNLLEGIFFGLTGRSFRTNRERELIREGSQSVRVELKLTLTTGKMDTALSLTTGAKKTFTVNGNRAAPGQIPEIPPPVVFNPDHLSIIKGNPQERRRWLDQELGIFHPGYLFNWRRYQHALAQRNDLLRKIREKRSRPAGLSVWNEQVCHYGGMIMAARLSLLSRFTPLARDIYNQIAGRGEKLVISYRSSFPLSGLRESGDISRLMSGQLEEHLNEDLVRGQTGRGPHRDDLLFSLDGFDVRQYGSQGQQRSIILSLKLAQIELCRLDFKEYPVVLLDDVLSELDRMRREQLFSRLSGLTQSFITTSEEVHNKSSGVVYIRDGQIWEGE
ncbi:DNA replication/repair protein RecF [Desulfotomaculum copahuensis]|uniref:DNA replication/repair protein RecF n=1 Tax=Desulfotomaculum copahuensis TaxID=1838280 RepID=UPI00137352C6|nr:DNA replication/repair protein RecF [Desulfotomaculum copahuensis]